MDTAGLSTAVMLALAAVLWFLYFVPAWIRRREYLATERTATRLQRTMRIMAEAAEAPDEVHLEASAREAARAERLRLAQERESARRALRDAEAAAAERAQIDVDRRRAAAFRAAAATGTPAPNADRRRLVGVRRAAGLVLLVTLLVGVYQLWLMVSVGVAPGAWVVLGGSVVVAAISVSAQGRIRRRLARAPISVTIARPPLARRSQAGATEVAAPQREWTPLPLPRPRYIEHPDAVPVGPGLGAPTMDAAARLRVVAAAAELADDRVKALPAREVESPAASPVRSTPSRYASMGVVEGLTEAPDLDDVLARRRKVG